MNYHSFIEILISSENNIKILDLNDIFYIKIIHGKITNWKTY
uniref:Uncharacterized protein n=1 Tax=viral metagenome TaxID=1070528 RepID=A0A6C0LQA6_9ZZZZ